jgi:uncharacterized membrane protein
MKKIFSFLPVVLFLGNVILVANIYPHLPDIIPSHFNIKGEVDGYGDKSTILIPLILQLGLSLLLMWVGNHPEKHNYTVAITDENRAEQYSLSSRLIRRLNFIIGLVFITITYSITTPTFPKFIVLMELALIFGVIVLHLYQPSKRH